MPGRPGQRRISFPDKRLPESEVPLFKKQLPPSEWPKAQRDHLTVPHCREHLSRPQGPVSLLVGTRAIAVSSRFVFLVPLQSANITTSFASIASCHSEIGHAQSGLTPSHAIPSLNRHTAIPNAPFDPPGGLRCLTVQVAQLLEKNTWKPDTKLVTQGCDGIGVQSDSPRGSRGDLGTTFFMIYSGQAVLMVRDDQGEDVL